MMIVSSETVGWLETIDAAFGPHTHLCNQATIAAKHIAAPYREHLMAVLVKWFLTECCQFGTSLLCQHYIKEGLVVKWQKCFS